MQTVHALLSLVFVGCAAENAVLERLNKQWEAGKPSNDLTAAGVLVHVFDNQYPKNPDRPWLPCPVSDWCNYVSDRLSTSLINKPAGGIFTPGSGYQALGGMVMNTQALQDALLCAWSEDGNTMSRLCKPFGNSSTCIPGCYSSSSQPCWCSDGHNTCFMEQTATSLVNVTVAHPEEYCPHRPWHLDVALQNQQQGHGAAYNELVIDANMYTAALPKALDAIFYPKSCGDAEIARATKVHQDAMAYYKLTPAELPLLELAIWEDPPFACVTC